MEKEKKEIGMEKLIELLNEYEIWKGKNGLDIRQEYAEHNFKYNKYLYVRVISKKYGFIKWLVENDKIDNKKIADETYVKVNGEWYELILGCHYDLYQQTLMLLSISDTPIEDLISYLR